MKTIGKQRIRSLVCAITMAVGATAWNHAASAAELGLLGYRWDKPVVTYWISVGHGVSQAAINDVTAAFEEWNQALQSLPGAPTFALASSRRKAVLTLDLQARFKSGRSPFYGNPELGFLFDANLAGDAGWSTSCTLASVKIQMGGSILTEPQPDTRTHNLALHVLGHALGLGESDCSSTVMGLSHVWNEWDIPNELLLLSACDLAGVAEVYTATTCEQIPTAISCTCP